jgi:hypothetical protein
VQLSPESLERGIDVFASEIRTSILTIPTEWGRLKIVAWPFGKA